MIGGKGGSERSQTWHVLDVGGKKKVAGFDYQHSKTEVLTTTIQFVGDISTEQARSDDDNIKGVAAVITNLRLRVAHRAAENVMGKGGCWTSAWTWGSGLSNPVPEMQLRGADTHACACFVAKQNDNAFEERRRTRAVLMGRVQDGAAFCLSAPLEPSRHEQ
jgi:hypothetical protein